MNVFNLFAKLSLDKSDYEKNLNEAKKQGEDFADNTKNKVSPKAVIGWTAIATAVITVIKKVKDLALETAKYADQIGDTAEKWGFATKELQEFDYWATQNGTTLESLLTGMRGLVNQAQAGSSAFDKLGVSVKNADGTLKDQRTLFLETITALQKMENQTERNALQFDIFGRSGVELGQVINKTGDELEALSQKAEEYGLIISDTAIKASSDFNDNLDTLKRQFKSAVAEMLTGGADAEERVEKYFDNLIDNIEEYLPKFLRFIMKFLSTIAQNLPRILEPLVMSLVDWFVDYLASLDWFTLTFKVAWAIIKGLFKGIVNAISGIFGFKVFDDNKLDVESNSTTNAINSVTTANVSEKTTKVDEKLEVTLNVESDGTVASEQNLNIISDMLVDKIDKALGDMING